MKNFTTISTNENPELKIVDRKYYSIEDIAAMAKFRIVSMFDDINKDCIAVDIMTDILLDEDFIYLIEDSEFGLFYTIGLRYSNFGLSVGGPLEEMNVFDTSKKVFTKKAVSYIFTNFIDIGKVIEVERKHVVKEKASNEAMLILRKQILSLLSTLSLPDSYEARAVACIYAMINNAVEHGTNDTDIDFLEKELIGLFRTLPGENMDSHYIETNIKIFIGTVEPRRS